MSKHTKLIVGWGMVISGGALFSLGAMWSWGLTGAFIAGGIYSAICGATVLGVDW